MSQALSPNAAFPAAAEATGSRTDVLWPTMAVVFVVAALMRWLGYTGFFGSDEVTYVHNAYRVLNGDWSLDSYVGGNRLGVNLPMAAFGWVFGGNEFGAALFSLLSSLGEVVLVTWVAGRMFGSRTALFAGLLIATAPTHVHFAGRLMADAPLCLTITASFVLFYEAERRNWSWGYLFAGLCAGLSFWIKPVTLFVFAILLAYPLMVRRLDRRWLWVAVGVAAAILANCLLCWLLSGNFFFIFDSMRDRQRSGYLESGVQGGQIHNGAFFYLSYLFAKVHHTALIGFLALAAVLLAFARRLPEAAKPGVRFTLFWGLGLLAILSLLPVSFRPLLFVPKQLNYMLIFLAPLCILGGYFLSRLPRAVAVVLTVAAVATGTLFSLFLQHQISVFTANSRAVLAHMQTKPGATFYVMSNAVRFVEFSALVGGPDHRTQTMHLKSWIASPATVAAERYAVVDAESFAWDQNRPFTSLQDVPACWVPMGALTAEARGPGSSLMRALAAWRGWSDTGFGQRLRELAAPKPAQIYRLPPSGGC